MPGPAVNVRAFGAAGNGLQDDTPAFALALRASQTVYAPAGTYLVETLRLPSGSTLLTDGHATRFKQRRGLPAGVRILTVTGSNVRIGDCTVEGNIATDSGEQRHGVFVGATAETGPISNVSVGNIHGINLRGDAVYVGAWNSEVSNVEIGDVYGSNILRNVVSVVGGRNISIGHISGSRVGFKHLDIEPDEADGPVVGCNVASVRGGFAQVAGQTPSSYVDNVRIGLVELVAPAPGSIPAYVPGLPLRDDAFVIRNVRSLEIGQIVVRGFIGAAMQQVWNPGALPDQYVHIGNAAFIDCARESGRQAYVEGSRKATHLSIDSLTVEMPRPGIDVVRNCKSARIGRLTRRLPRGSRLIAETSDIATPLAYATVAAGAAVALLQYRRRYWG
jgi:hypothetical protein